MSYLMRLLLLLLGLISPQFVTANSVDRIQTDKDAQAFIDKQASNKRSKDDKFVILPTDTMLKHLDCGDLAREWGIKSWQKADFNSDGKTDLLVVGRDSNFDCLVFIDMGDDKFRAIQLSKDPFQGCEVGKPVMIDGQQMILFYYAKARFEKANEDVQLQTDTLVYKFGSFVEYNAKPMIHQLKTLKISVSPCFGTCPVYQLVLKASGQADYIAERFNPKNGKFRGQVAADKLKEIRSLVNYLDIAKLKGDYAVNWTDFPSADLHLEFEDGTVKDIHDYGKQGSYGLSRLYSLISALRTSERWHK